MTVRPVSRVANWIIIDPTPPAPFRTRSVPHAIAYHEGANEERDEERGNPVAKAGRRHFDGTPSRLSAPQFRTPR